MFGDCERYIVYSGGLSVATPLAMLYNLRRVSPLSNLNITTGVAKLFPVQFLLRCVQLQLSTCAANQTNNPLIGFGIVGLTQGVIYNHCVQYWSNTKPPISRGLVFAVPRDMVSQGVPYVSGTPLLPTSVLSTVISQGFHNCQLHMQITPGIRYRECLSSIYKKHGISWLYKGVSGRLGLMTFTNVINHYTLQW